jgi:hypothetical protein
MSSSTWAPGRDSQRVHARILACVEIPTAAGMPFPVRGGKILRVFPGGGKRSRSDRRRGCSDAAQTSVSARRRSDERECRRGFDTEKVEELLNEVLGRIGEGVKSDLP